MHNSLKYIYAERNDLTVIKRYTIKNESNVLNATIWIKVYKKYLPNCELVFIVLSFS